MRETVDLILLNSLYGTGRLSKSVYVLCSLSELNTIDDLKSFYERNDNLISIKYCDWESNEELILLSCKNRTLDKLSFHINGKQKYLSLYP